MHAKAKSEPGYRFYTLYDKVCRSDILEFAYLCSRANDGSMGIDGQDYEDIEADGREAWLGKLARELKDRTYAPQAVRRVYIKKENGKLRPLGIPTIKDRVAQTAAVLVLGPIFEADLPAQQYAYRPNRSALDAVEAAFRLLRSGHTQVVDADLSGYFDSIPHADLMKSVARRVCDKHMLHIIQQWLDEPIEETDERGRKHRSTPNRDAGRGTPQGAPISPLLSNIYMRRFVAGWKTLGHEKRLDAHIVNYADDFVICCRGRADEAAAIMRGMMKKLKLTVNEEKTRTCRLPEKSFDFLGYTFGREYSRQTGDSYIGRRPSKKKVQRLCKAVSEQTDRRHTLLDVQEMVGKLNRMMAGWANYFRIGSVRKAYDAVNAHVRKRLRQWLCRKHGLSARKAYRYPAQYLYGQLGLRTLSRAATDLSCAKA